MAYSKYNHGNINVLDNLFKELTNKDKKKQVESTKIPPKQKIIVNEIKRHDIIPPSEIKDDDLSSLFYKLVIQFNFKIAFLLFIFYILFNTDIFNKFVISKFEKDIYVNDKITEKGLLIIGTLLSLTYIMLDVLNNNEYI